MSDADKLLDAQIRFIDGEMKREEIRDTLAILRKTRAARGGAGTVQVPAHLKDASEGQGIVITDEDLAYRKNSSRGN